MRDQEQFLHVLDRDEAELLHRRGVFAVRLARIVALVVVEHRGEVGSAERLDVLLPDLRILHPAGEPFGGQRFLRAFGLEPARVGAVGLLLGIVRELAIEPAKILEAPTTFPQRGQPSRRGLLLIAALLASLLVAYLAALTRERLGH